jgi:hypothetical protein
VVKAPAFREFGLDILKIKDIHKPWGIMIFSSGQEWPPHIKTVGEEFRTLDFLKPF